MTTAVRMRWLDLQRWGLLQMDSLSLRLPKTAVTAPHLATGLLGEREALLHLRGLGYVVVARRWTSGRLRGDVDLIGWDGERLCFVEVKTRARRDPMEPAEAAVNEEKRRMVRLMAGAYLKGFPRETRDRVRELVRFDVVLVYLSANGLRKGAAEFEVRKGAFGWE